MRWYRRLVHRAITLPLSVLLSLPLGAPVLAEPPTHDMLRGLAAQMTDSDEMWWQIVKANWRVVEIGKKFNFDLLNRTNILVIESQWFDPERFDLSLPLFLHEIREYKQTFNRMPRVQLFWHDPRAKSEVEARASFILVQAKLRRLAIAEGRPAETFTVPEDAVAGYLFGDSAESLTQLAAWNASQRGLTPLASGSATPNTSQVATTPEQPSKASSLSTLARQAQSLKAAAAAGAAVAISAAMAMAPAPVQGAQMDAVRPPAISQPVQPSDSVAGTQQEPEPTEADIPRLIQDLRRLGGGSSAALALRKLGGRAVPALLKALEDPDDVLRFVATQVLGDIKDPRAIDPLASHVREDPDFFVRTQAAESLGFIGPAAAPVLLELLKLPEAPVRRAVAKALGSAGDARAITPLIRIALKDPDRDLGEVVGQSLAWIRDREAVMAAVAKLPLSEPNLPDVLVPLILNRQTRKPDPRIVNLLLRLGKRAYPRLLKEADFEISMTVPADVRREAVLVLGRMHDPQLLGPLRDLVPGERVEFVLEALRQAMEQSLQPPAVARRPLSSQEIKRLVRQASDPSAEKRIDALRRLQGQRGPLAIQAVLRGLKDRRVEVRIVAIQALAVTPSPRRVETLGSLIERDPDDQARLAAAKALTTIGTPAALRRILQAVPGVRQYLREELAKVLVTAGPAALTVIEEAVKANDAILRRFGMMALAEIQAPQAFDLLVEGLKDSELVVRIEAAKSLAARKDPRALVPLREALTREQEESVQAALREAIKQLQQPATPESPERSSDTGTKALQATAPPQQVLKLGELLAGGPTLTPIKYRGPVAGPPHPLPAYLWQALQQWVTTTDARHQLAPGVYTRLAQQLADTGEVNLAWLDASGTIQFAPDAVAAFVEAFNAAHPARASPLTVADAYAYLETHERYHQQFQADPTAVDRLLTELRATLGEAGFATLQAQFANNYGPKYRADAREFVEELLVVYLTEQQILGQAVLLLPEGATNLEQDRIALPIVVSEALDRNGRSVGRIGHDGMTRRQVLAAGAVGLATVAGAGSLYLKRLLTPRPRLPRNPTIRISAASGGSASYDAKQQALHLSTTNRLTVTMQLEGATDVNIVEFLIEGDPDALLELETDSADGFRQKGLVIAKPGTSCRISLPNAQPLTKIIVTVQVPKPGSPTQVRFARMRWFNGPSGTGQDGGVTELWQPPARAELLHHLRQPGNLLRLSYWVRRATESGMSRREIAASIPAAVIDASLFESHGVLLQPAIRQRIPSLKRLLGALPSADLQATQVIADFPEIEGISAYMDEAQAVHLRKGTQEMGVVTAGHEIAHGVHRWLLTDDERMRLREAVKQSGIDPRNYFDRLGHPRYMAIDTEDFAITYDAWLGDPVGLLAAAAGNPLIREKLGIVLKRFISISNGRAFIRAYDIRDDRVDADIATTELAIRTSWRGGTMSQEDVQRLSDDVTAWLRTRHARGQAPGTEDAPGPTGGAAPTEGGVDARMVPPTTSAGSERASAG